MNALTPELTEKLTAIGLREVRRRIFAQRQAKRNRAILKAVNDNLHSIDDSELLKAIKIAADSVSFSANADDVISFLNR